MGAFKAYDIRGIYGQEITDDMAYRIGFFLPEVLKASKILVGRDVRPSSDALASALIQGITAAGVDVLDAGHCTTPMVYFASGRQSLDGSVQITASHNPSEYNGMKVSGKQALPIGYDQGLGHLQRLIQQPPVPRAIRGRVQRIDLKDDYLAFLQGYRKHSDLGMNVVIDASNGMAGMLVREVFGSQFTYLNETPDGRFPAHDPNPLDADSRAQLVTAVLEQAASLGMIFDGDGDRVMFVDEKGDFISPDLMIALLGHHFLENKAPQVVLQDIRTSRSVAEYLARWNARVVTWRVGRAFAAPKLREIKGIYGGELAGHYYFQDFFYSDSGLLAALLISQIFNRKMEEGIPPSRVMGAIKSYHNTGEVNFRVEDKPAAIQAIKMRLACGERPEGVLDFDGYRMDFKDWWFNVRESNTEPYLRFIAEARDQAFLDEKLYLARQVAMQFS